MRPLSASIGETPLLSLKSLEAELGEVRLLAKAEQLNPGHSVKDRPALRMIAEAERSGLVSRVVQDAKLLEEARAVAAKIASFSTPALMMAKEAVNQAYETPLAEGVRFERRLFHASFALADQKEGMAAFVGKRKPSFRHR